MRSDLFVTSVNKLLHLLQEGCLSNLEIWLLKGNHLSYLSTYKHPEYWCCHEFRCLYVYERRNPRWSFAMLWGAAWAAEACGNAAGRDCLSWQARSNRVICRRVFPFFLYCRRVGQKNKQVATLVTLQNLMARRLQEVLPKLESLQIPMTATCLQSFARWMLPAFPLAFNRVFPCI